MLGIVCSHSQGTQSLSIRVDAALAAVRVDAPSPASCWHVIARPLYNTPLKIFGRRRQRLALEAVWAAAAEGLFQRVGLRNVVMLRNEYRSPPSKDRCVALHRVEERAQAVPVQRLPPSCHRCEVGTPIRGDRDLDRRADVDLQLQQEVAHTQRTTFS